MKDIRNLLANANPITDMRKCHLCQNQVSPGQFLAIGGIAECSECSNKKTLGKIYSEAQAMLPLSLQKATYKNIEDEGNIADLKILLEDSLFDKKTSIALHGTSGSGKSTLLAATYRRGAASGLHTRWFNFQNLWKEHLVWRGSRKGESPLDHIVRAGRKGILFLDDVFFEEKQRYGMVDMETAFESAFRAGRRIFMAVETGHLGKRLVNIIEHNSVKLMVTADTYRGKK